MIFKKKYFLFTIFIIFILQILLYTNNNQRTSFRYFKWTFKEVSIGKLISISFFSGLFVSSLLTNTITNNRNNPSEKIEENNEPQINEDYISSNLEMPPQRDLRDAQPTISVNYRVVKNTEQNNLKKDQNYSNNSDEKDGWDYSDNEW